MSTYSKLMIVFFAVFMVSLWILSLLKIVMNLTVAPLFGLRCCTISGFGLLFMNEDGKWKCKKDKFMPVIQDMVVIDILKPVPEDVDKKSALYMLICNIAELIVAVAAFILLKEQVRAGMQWHNASASQIFLGALGCGLLLNAVVHFFMGLYARLVLMKTLAGYVDVMVKKMRQGVPFDAMDLKPISQLPYKKPNKMEKMMYYQLYVPYLIWNGDIDGLKEPMEEMREYFAKRDFILQETLNYYWLIFYYSRYEIHPVNADAFFERVSRTLLNDTDANAKRVLAYYYYGVKNDIPKAQQCLREGFAVIDKFSVPGPERDLERKLLLDLDEIIQRRLAYEQETKNKI